MGELYYLLGAKEIIQKDIYSIVSKMNIIIFVNIRQSAGH